MATHEEIHTVIHDTTPRDAAGRDATALPEYLKVHRFSKTNQPLRRRGQKIKEHGVLSHTEVTYMFRERTIDAANAIVGILHSPKARDCDKLRAAELILNYSVGKAPQAIHMAISKFENEIEQEEDPQKKQLDALMSKLTDEDKALWSKSVLSAIKDIRGAVPTSFKVLTDESQETTSE